MIYALAIALGVLFFFVLPLVMDRVAPPTYAQLPRYYGRRWRHR